MKATAGGALFVCARAARAELPSSRMHCVRSHPECVCFCVCQGVSVGPSTTPVQQGLQFTACHPGGTGAVSVAFVECRVVIVCGVSVTACRCQCCCCGSQPLEVCQQPAGRPHYQVPASVRILQWYIACTTHSNMMLRCGTSHVHLMYHTSWEKQSWL